MGSFLASVHVRSRRDPQSLIAACIANAEGMRVVPDDAKQVDRTLVFVARDGWLTLYDTDFEGQDVRKLEEAASLASRVLEAPAISALVHDSDVLDLRLFEQGARVDRFDSNPAYFAGKATPAQKRDARGRPEKWHALLGVDATALRAAWDGEDLLAEQTLEKTCALLGLPAESALTSARYLDEEALRDARVIRLARTERPAWERPAQGGARLVHESFVPVTEHRLAVGDEVNLVLSGRNAAGEGRGIAVEVEGDGLALVSISKIWIRTGDLLSHENESRELPAEKTEHGYAAVSPDVPIPPGVAQGLGEMRDPATFGEAHAAIRRASVVVNVVGRVERPGRGGISVRVVPEGRPDAAMQNEHALAIEPPMWRPLHARANVSSHQLRPLLVRDIVTALVVTERSREDLLPFARRAAEAVVAHGGPRVVDVNVFRAEPGKRPTTRKAKDITSARAWAKLSSSFANEQQVQLVTELSLDLVGTGRHPRSGGYGFALGGAVLPRGKPDDPELVALVAWADVSMGGAPLIAALSALVDDVMRDGGVQGMLARWGEPGSIEYTPYESATGVSGGIVTLRSWATRFLRAVGTEATWLGPSLRARVGPLGGEVQTTEVGAALRVSGDVVSVERALAALLPTEEQHLHAVRVYYGHAT